MTKNYSVYRKPDGEWAVKRDDASTVSSTHGTQQDAYDAAKGYSQNAGGGEVSVHGVDGEVRYKNTIAPAHDPRETKG